jgi:chemotaxis protein histidine kinase CheA
MVSPKTERPTISTYADHEVITPPNKLVKAVAKVALPGDDPVARAEAALAQLSSEFSDWMAAECARLDAARHTVKETGFTKKSLDEMFHAAHDIKGDAATFGYPLAAPAAESLCRVLEHTPDPKRIPMELIDQHVDAVRAIVREYARHDIAEIASRLNVKLVQVTQEFLTHENKHRPGYLDGVFSPPIAPSDAF